MNKNIVTSTIKKPRGIKKKSAIKKKGIKKQSAKKSQGIKKQKGGEGPTADELQDYAKRYQLGETPSPMVRTIGSYTCVKTQIFKDAGSALADIYSGK